MSFIKQLWKQLESAIGKMPKSQKISFFMITGTLVLMVIILSAFYLKDNKVPLFKNQQINQEDLAKVTEYMSKNKIEYTLSNGNILVNPEDREKVKMDIYANNMVSSGTNSYDWIFDTDWSSSYSQLNKKLQISRQLSIEKKLSLLSKLDSASVEINFPEQTELFSMEKPKATASVLVQLKKGEALSKQNVIAIAKLVSGAIGKELAMEDVKIADTNMNYYKVPTENEFDTYSNDQLLIKKMFEDDAKAKIKDFFRSIIGPVVVQADFQLNFDKKTTSKTNKDLKIVEKTEESTKITNQTKGGTPETSKPMEIVSEFNGDNESKKENSIKNSEEIVKVTPVVIEKGVETTDIVYQPGLVTDKHVAIFVPYDKAILTPDKKKLKNKEDEALQLKTNLNQWKTHVANILGISENEKEAKISITAMSFEKPAMPATIPTSTAAISILKQYIPHSILFLAIIIIGFMVIRILKNAVPGDLLEEINKVRQQMKSEEKLEIKTSAEPNPEDLKNVQIKQHVNDVVNNNPRSVANVLKRWMKE